MKHRGYVPGLPLSENKRRKAFTIPQPANSIMIIVESQYDPGLEV